MTIVRYNPNRATNRVSRDFDSIFDSFFGNSGHVFSSEGALNPRVDITEDKDKVMFHLEVPGMKKEDVKVVVEDGVLTVSGDRKINRDEKETNYVWSERVSGSFSRSFKLPEYAEVDNITADYKDGVLNILIPKAEVAKPKEIEVKVD